MKEGRKEGVGKNNKKEKKRERKEKKVWSAIGRVQFDVGCDRARPSIRNSRRGNKSSRKTCELVPCHQLWSVAIARRNIASNWEKREEGEGDRVTRGIGVQRGERGEGEILFLEDSSAEWD